MAFLPLLFPACHAISFTRSRFTFRLDECLCTQNAIIRSQQYLHRFISVASPSDIPFIDRNAFFTMYISFCQLIATIDLVVDEEKNALDSSKRNHLKYGFGFYIQLIWIVRLQNRGNTIDSHSKWSLTFCAIHFDGLIKTRNHTFVSRTAAAAINH